MLSIFKTKKQKTQTLMDQMKKSGQYKSKELKKSDHKKIWAFKGDTITIGKFSDFWCVGEINGKVFALNGNAQDKFGLKSAHDSGNAIQGKSISRFIEMALNL